VKHGHNAFGCEPAVGNQTDEERRDQGGDRNGAEQRSRLGSGEVKGLDQISADGDVPRSPHHVVHEHHDAGPQLKEGRIVYTWRTAVNDLLPDINPGMFAGALKHRFNDVQLTQAVLKRGVFDRR
jgi:hypothetical protein